jgi:hypothetical protein
MASEGSSAIDDQKAIFLPTQTGIFGLEFPQVRFRVLTVPKYSPFIR